MMRLFTTTIALTVLSTAVGAKPWREITPLHSSAADVERILGTPSDSSNNWSIYQTKDEAISILYSNGLPCGAGANSDWQVAKGIVVSITVAPKKLILFSTLNLDESKFQKLTDSYHLKQIKYLNLNDGLSISVVNDEVGSFTYTGEVADERFRCAHTRTSEEMTTQLTYSLDIYRNLRPKDEEIRLDNFAVELTQLPAAKGYIMVYSGDDVSPANARARAQRAKKYLVKVRGITSERLVTIYGGKHKEFSTTLYIVPKGAKPPSPI